MSRNKKDGRIDGTNSETIIFRKMADRDENKETFLILLCVLTDSQALSCFAGFGNIKYNQPLGTCNVIETSLLIYWRYHREYFTTICSGNIASFIYCISVVYQSTLHTMSDWPDKIPDFNKLCFQTDIIQMTRSIKRHSLTSISFIKTGVSVTHMLTDNMYWMSGK